MRRFNLDEMIWMIILLLLDVMIIYAVITGNIYNLASEHVVKFSYVTIVLLSILVIFQTPRIFTVPGRQGVNKSSIIFVLALCVFFIGISKTTKFTSSANFVNLLISEENHENHKEEEIPEGVINMTDKNFYCYLEQIQKQPHKYEGRNIKVSGEVRFQNGEYMITKSVMNCCAADAKVYGIILDVKTGTKITGGKSYTVTGRLKNRSIRFNKRNIALPVIEISSVQAD